MQWLRTQVRKSPRLVLGIGKAVFLAGCILILGAVFARASMINLNAERTQAKQAPLMTLAQAWPQYPTWIVPEGPVGYTVSAVLVLLGMAITIVATDVRKGKDVRSRRW